MKLPKHRAPVWVLAVLIFIVLFLTLFCIPTKGYGAPVNEWVQTHDRPNQWRKELGPKKGDQVLIAESGHGSLPMYIYLRRCAGVQPTKHLRGQRVRLTEVTGGVRITLCPFQKLETSKSKEANYLLNFSRDSVTGEHEGKNESETARHKRLEHICSSLF